MGKRVCNETGCPILIDGPGRCPQHQREAEVKRGSRQARGYGKDHDTERAKWKAILDRRPWPCARCDAHIMPGEPWHLDHSDDRTRYIGPSHALCNLSAAGRAAHK